MNNVERLYGLLHAEGAVENRTGPFDDHTSKTKEGYFMVAQSTDFTVAQTARLLSPLYQASQSINSCFQFNWFMNGQENGILRVFLKRKSDDLDDVTDDTRFVLVYFIS